LRPSYRQGPPKPSFAKPADYKEETGSDEIKKPPHNAIFGGGHTMVISSFEPQLSNEHFTSLHCDRAIDAFKDFVPATLTSKSQPLSGCFLQQLTAQVGENPKNP
jgi:hypothetical protein